VVRWCAACGMALGLAACVSNAAKTEYEKITGNPIPRIHNDVVLWRAQGHPAKSVLIGVAKPPEAVARDLAAVIETQWGVAERNLPFTDAVASFRSKPYNIAPEASSAVFVEVHRFPGSEAMSLVVLERQDKWRGWGRGFHTGLRLPWKVWTDADVVTKRELDAVLAYFEGAGVKTAYAFPDWPKKLRDTAAISAIRQELLGPTAER